MEYIRTPYSPKQGIHIYKTMLTPYRGQEVQERARIWVENWAKPLLCEGTLFA